MKTISGFNTCVEGTIMNQISISEVQRNLHQLDDFDIVEIVDKKRNKIKGYFIESKYAPFVEEIAEKIESYKKRRQKRPAGMLRRYADAAKISGEKDFWQQRVVQNYTRDEKL